MTLKTEVMAAENSAFYKMNKLLFKIYLNCKNISQYFSVCVCGVCVCVCVCVLCVCVCVCVVCVCVCVCVCALSLYF